MCHASSRGSLASWDAVLLPRGLGDSPWANPRYRSMARAMDNWAFGFVVANNILGMYAMYTRFPASRTVLQTLPSVFFVAAGIAQQIAVRKWPDWYYRHRHHILVLQRLARLPMIAYVPYTVRSNFVRSVAQRAIDGSGACSPPFSENINALGFLLALSGAMHALMHVAAVPLPFPQQLLFQTACLAILVVFNLAPAAFTLERAPAKPQLQRMCHGLNSALVLLSSAYGGMYLDLDEVGDICQDAMPLQMLLFVQLYFCFVLPLYYSYRLDLECRLHMRQAAPAPGDQQPYGDERAADACAPLAVAGDAAVLLSMLLVCWLAAIAAQPHLPRIMWPVGEGLPAP